MLPCLTVRLHTSTAPPALPLTHLLPPGREEQHRLEVPWSQGCSPRALPACASELHQLPRSNPPLWQQRLTWRRCRRHGEFLATWSPPKEEAFQYPTETPSPACARGRTLESLNSQQIWGQVLPPSGPGLMLMLGGFAVDLGSSLPCAITIG